MASGWQSRTRSVRGVQQSSLDSNGLRVLERVGSIAPSPSYATSYRAGVASLQLAGVGTLSVAREAFILPTAAALERWPINPAK